MGGWLRHRPGGMGLRSGHLSITGAMGPSTSWGPWPRPVVRAAVGRRGVHRSAKMVSRRRFGALVYTVATRFAKTSTHTNPPKSLFFALISVGYASVSSTQVPSYMVTCFGLPIYEITSSSNGPVGQAVGANMAIIGMACTFGMGLVVELALAARVKDK